MDASLLFFVKLNQCWCWQELNHRPRKQTEYGLSEIEDIIWEVDEDANGWLDWENFVQLYIRCTNDRTVTALFCLWRTLPSSNVHVRKRGEVIAQFLL